MAKPRRNLNTLLDGKNPFEAKKNGGKRTIAQHEEDLVFISERYLTGMTQTKIMHELNAARKGQYELSDSQIYVDVDTLHKRWIVAYLDNFDELKAKELAHIDRLEREYWEAWEQSKNKIEEVESESIQDKQGSNRNAEPSYARTRVKKKETNRDGNDRFLAGVQWCIEQRCKIFGFNIAVSTKNINVNWREEAQQAGVDPDGAVNDLVKQFVQAASVGREDGPGGVGEGAKDS